MEKRIGLLGMYFNNVTMSETLESIEQLIIKYKEDKIAKSVITVNVDFMVNAHAWLPGAVRHPELFDVMQNADLTIADGMSLVWLSKIMGSPLKERVSGSDLTPLLAKMAVKKNYSLFLLGGKDNVAYRAARILESHNSGLKIAGCAVPFVHTEGSKVIKSIQQDEELVKRINDAKPDILLIAFGNPKQELWFNRNRDKLKVPVSIGIGGTFEFITGSVSRAPKKMQQLGMEWIYRISQDPKRLLKRYIKGLFKFVAISLPAIFGNLFKQNLSTTAVLRLNRFQNTKSKNRSLKTEAEICLDNSLIVLNFNGSFNQKEIRRRDIFAFIKKINTSQIVLDFQKVSYSDHWTIAGLKVLIDTAGKNNKNISIKNISPVMNAVLKRSQISYEDYREKKSAFHSAYLPYEELARIR